MNTCTCRQQNRTNTSPTKTRKIPPRTPDSSDLNPHPKMPPIAVSKPTAKVDDNKPDLVQEAHGGDDQESVPEKMDDEDEGRAPSRLAGGGQPDEDFEFGDQADPELAVLQ